MRRRALLASAPLVWLLAACDPGKPTAAEGMPAAPVEDPEPVLREQRAPLVTPEELKLPLEMTPMIVVDPGWTATPLQLDGIFLGYCEDADHLTFVAVDQDGTLLWEADRPLGCTGFTLTRAAGDQPVAVLADLATTEEAIAMVTLNGYDLRTAELLWGPVEAPGPHAAPGLVYSAPTDVPMGPGGPRTALSGASGAPALAETDLSGGRILAEHLGTILYVTDTHLIATGSDGTQRWARDLPGDWDLERLGVVGSIDAVTSYAVLSDQQHPELVLDLSDGAEVAREADAVEHDHVNDITVLAAGATVRGLDAQGVEQWRHDDPEQVNLISAGERLAYAVREEEGTLVVLDTLRGLMVQPYDVDHAAPLAMPELFSADTAAVVRAGSRRCLVTTVFDENFGMRD